MAGTDEDKAATDTNTERPASAGDRLAARRAAKAARKAAERGTAPALNEAVAANVEAATSWYSGHQTSLWLVTGAVLIVGGGAYALNAHFANQRAEAASLLAQATTTALAPVVGSDDAALLENVDESYPTAKARAEQVLTHYKALAKAFPESRVTSWAKLGEANALFALGRYEDAEARYKEARGGEAESYVQARALEGEGLALAGRKKYVDAAAKFDDMAKLAGGLYAPLADYQRARMLRALDRRDDAKQVLGKLIAAAEAKPADDLISPGPSYDSVTEAAKSLLAELSSDAAPLRVELTTPEPPAAAAQPAVAEPPAAAEPAAPVAPAAAAPPAAAPAAPKRAPAPAAPAAPKQAPAPAAPEAAAAPAAPTAEPEAAPAAAPAAAAAPAEAPTPTPAPEAAP